MKFVQPHPFGDPDAAARKLVEIASGGEGEPKKQGYEGMIRTFCAMLAAAFAFSTGTLKPARLRPRTTPGHCLPTAHVSRYQKMRPSILTARITARLTSKAVEGR